MKYRQTECLQQYHIGHSSTMLMHDKKNNHSSKATSKFNLKYSQHKTSITAEHKITFLDQSSNSSWVLSFSLKLSPSAFSFCPSTWFSQPLPRTSSTRRMYAFSWRSICRAHVIDPANGGKSRTRLI